MKLLESIKERINNDELCSIVFYGASTVSAEYIFPNWPEILRYVLKNELETIIGQGKKSYWKIQTANRGLNGGKSQDLLDYFNDWILTFKPNILFLSISKNDPFFNIDLKITEHNTRTIIKQALDKGIKVIFSTTMPSLKADINVKIASYVETDKKVAKEFQNSEAFVFVDLFNLYPKNLITKSYTLINVEGNKVLGIAPGEIDTVHPNRYGNAIIAQIILKEAFGISFNAETFLEDLADQSVKYPRY